MPSFSPGLSTLQSTSTTQTIQRISTGCAHAPHSAFCTGWAMYGSHLSTLNQACPSIFNPSGLIGCYVARGVSNILGTISSLIQQDIFQYGLQNVVNSAAYQSLYAFVDYIGIAILGVVWFVAIIGAFFPRSQKYVSSLAPIKITAVTGAGLVLLVTQIPSVLTQFIFYIGTSIAKAILSIGFTSVLSTLGQQAGFSLLIKAASVAIITYFSGWGAFFFVLLLLGLIGFWFFLILIEVVAQVGGLLILLIVPFAVAFLAFGTGVKWLKRLIEFTLVSAFLQVFAAIILLLSWVLVLDAFESGFSFFGTLIPLAMAVLLVVPGVASFNSFTSLMHSSNTPVLGHLGSIQGQLSSASGSGGLFGSGRSRSSTNTTMPYASAPTSSASGVNNETRSSAINPSASSSVATGVSGVAATAHANGTGANSQEMPSSSTSNMETGVTSSHTDANGSTTIPTTIGDGMASTAETEVAPQTQDLPQVDPSVLSTDQSQAIEDSTNAQGAVGYSQSGRRINQVSDTTRRQSKTIANKVKNSTLGDAARTLKNESHGTNAGSAALHSQQLRSSTQARAQAHRANAKHLAQSPATALGRFFSGGKTVDPPARQSLSNNADSTDQQGSDSEGQQVSAPPPPQVSKDADD